jgi:hypothetical protein
VNQTPHAMLGRIRHCISNEDPKQRQSTVPWCLRGVTGPSQRPPSTRYKTAGPAPSDMDRSMLRQAGTRRTSQRARRSAFTVTWTSTPDPVDIAGLGMEDRTPARTEHQRPMCEIVTWTAGRTCSTIPLIWVTQLATMIFWDVTLRISTQGYTWDFDDLALMR